ncbi:hypothetical protein Agub_g14455 [Astrephomene gubernaculifera]|uniref:Peptidase M11 gametolysin domain-containing protein n=1 Tax=Astrephomene gubernaculifera TaxID=47775 RepID=A0AAD3HS95_9CHLO|nr:hypothetical protein Agub_g14455 [Astrephomene gubernaculifera]
MSLQVQLSLLAPIISLIVVLAHGCQGFGTGVDGYGIASGTILMMVPSALNGRLEPSYYLQADDGQVYRLTFCSNVTVGDIPANSRASISYRSVKGGVMHSCKPPRLEQPRRLLFGDTISSPTKPTFLVFITTMCNASLDMAAASPAAILDMFAGSGDVSGNRTLAGYYDTCSYHQVSLTSSQVRIVTDTHRPGQPIVIPCSGSLQLPFTFSSGNDFDTHSCGHDNLLKWQYYLQTVAAEQGITPTDYHHQVMLLPKGFASIVKDCGNIAGTASIGPWFRRSSPNNQWGTGLIWWSGDNFGDLEVLFHEAGHNLGLAHASVSADCGYEQCDNTCAMGGAGGQGIRCLNAPHMWQLGWGQPSQQLSDSELGYGKQHALLIPPQHNTPRSSVLLTPANMTDNQQLYISARINHPPYDLPFEKALSGRPFVLVHLYNGSASVPYQATYLAATVGLGSNYTDAASGVTVYFMSWNAAVGASVTVCRRKDASEQACGDDLDDDCDLLSDADDPDCHRSRPPPPGSRSITGSITGLGVAAKPPSPSPIIRSPVAQPSSFPPPPKLSPPVPPTPAPSLSRLPPPGSKAPTEVVLPPPHPSPPPPTETHPPPPIRVVASRRVPRPPPPAAPVLSPPPPSQPLPPGLPPSLPPDTPPVPAAAAAPPPPSKSPPPPKRRYRKQPPPAAP